MMVNFFSFGGMFYIFLRVGVLTILAITSQLAFHRRQYPLMFWTLGFWLTLFRLLIVRVIAFYPQTAAVAYLQEALMAGVPAAVTDTLLILSAIPMYFWIKQNYKEWTEVKK